MLAARWHNESNLLALLNRAKLCRLTENAPGENITVTTGDSDPHHLWLSVSYPWAAIVNNDLKVVWILREKPSFELWMSTPVHVVCEAA